MGAMPLLSLHAYLRIVAGALVLILLVTVALSRGSRRVARWSLGFSLGLLALGALAVAYALVPVVTGGQDLALLWWVVALYSGPIALVAGVLWSLACGWALANVPRGLERSKAARGRAPRG